MPTAIRAAERQKPRLDLRVLDVSSQHDWPIEQNLLRLTLANLMMVPVLVGVARVPLELLEPGQKLIQDAHVRCICLFHTSVKRRGCSRGLTRGFSRDGSVLHQPTA